MSNLTPEQIVKRLKKLAPNCPKWLLNVNQANQHQKLTKKEQMEFAEYMVKTMRIILITKYLISCIERFGSSANGHHLFTHNHFSIELDEQVIENLLIHQIENPIMEEKSDERFLPVLHFYLYNDTREKKLNEKWIQNFIDDVIIDGFNLFITEPALKTAH